MKDKFGRDVDTIRISLTSDCQLRCRYCFTDDFYLKDCTLKKYNSEKKYLSENEIIHFIQKISREFGITRVRFTGGEPLLRSDLAQIIRGVSKISEISDISLTTNGILLNKSNLLNELVDSGLKRINVGIDTFDPTNFSTITQINDIDQAKRIIGNIKEGTLKAKKLGLNPIKINSVKGPWVDDDTDIKPVSIWANQHSFIHQIIPLMNLKDGSFGQVKSSSYCTLKENQTHLVSTGGQCEKCRRLRLTAEGDIKSCLFGDDNIFNIRSLGVDQAFLMAMDNRVIKGGKKLNDRYFFELGG